MAAKKTTLFTLAAPRPENAEEFVRLAWRLEKIAEDEGIPLKSIEIENHDGYHPDGRDGSGLEFGYTGKV